MKANPNPFNLTDREIEIIRLIKKEYSGKMIADELGIEITTVDSYLRSIRLKTGAHTLVGIAMVNV